MNFFALFLLACAWMGLFFVLALTFDDPQVRLLVVYSCFPVTMIVVFAGLLIHKMKKRSP